MNMKPEDKKLVAEALLEAAKAVTTSLTDLSEDNWLVVYHGTSLSEVPSLINGFDATRLKYRLYGGPKHRGLFVTPDFKTAERFAPYGEVVLELLVRAKNLHGTDYSGRTGRQQKQEKRTEEWLAGKFPNSFRPYLSLTLTQAAEPQALLIGLVSPKQILRVWYRASRADAGKWYTRNEFLSLGLEAGPNEESAQGIKKKVEDLGIDLSSPRLSLDEFLDATARLADVPRSRVESALSVRAPKGEDEIVRLIERFGFQPKAAQSFARKFMKSLTNKQVAKVLLEAASVLSAASSVHLISEDGDEELLFEQAHDLFNSQGIHLHSNYDRFFVIFDDADDERVVATAAMCLYDDDSPPSIEFSVAVAPDQQRKGLAKKLVEEVIRYTQQSSTEFDWGDDTEVEAYVANEQAMIPLLRGLGFEPSATDPKRWRRKAA
jgi:GNAT superfamily N-acetyltransferase